MVIFIKNLEKNGWSDFAMSKYVQICNFVTSACTLEISSSRESTPGSKLRLGRFFWWPIHARSSSESKTTSFWLSHAPGVCLDCGPWIRASRESRAARAGPTCGQVDYLPTYLSLGPYVHEGSDGMLS